MQLIYFIITILPCLKHVTSKFHCVGTCYSGRVFPKPEDIVHGKHLKGHSYKNITTDDPKKCYSSCVNDCRCKACQMKGARCELLDEDKTSSKADDFVAEEGYTYYDLKQELYKGKSHMIQPGVCYNGCCRSQPCMNGGTCVDHCQTPKHKFTCTCPAEYDGKVCEYKRFISCMDVLRTQPNPSNGIYAIYRHEINRIQNVSCAFERPSQAWTLIESYSIANRKKYETQSFYSNGWESNGDEPNWEDYRAESTLIKYIRDSATMFRATCEFPKRVGSITHDYLLGYLRDYDIINGEGKFSDCIKFAYINIRGQEFYNKTALIGHWNSIKHLHLNCGGLISNCQMKLTGSEWRENCFGYYTKWPYAGKTNCTATQQSTTQWWLGEQK
ncbi:hypothetical protein QZH41_018371 [Actinostola sp. cb2023]|nr:hypothetical protein QZH41_018371 [Actinostola sp. cb2023]